MTPDHVADATVVASTALLGVSLTTTVQVVQIVAGVLSAIGILVAITYHILKIRRLWREPRA